MSLAERFADDISLEYSLIDRMRVRGHVLKLQTITMLRTYFQQVRHVDWIEPQDLQRATDDFVRFVEDYARLHDIPLVPAQPKESHVDKAAEYLDRVADQERAVYCIIKVQEETSSFVSYVPKTGDDKERKIARGRRRINHYYFFLKDPEFGVGNSIRISSYAPFPVTVCFNGHHFVAQYLRSRGVGFQMCDNMFVAVDDPKAFRRAIRALTPRAIERFCDDWVYELTVWFPPRAKRQGFRYRWFLDQVEYSHKPHLPREGQAERFVRATAGPRPPDRSASRDRPSVPSPATTYSAHRRPRPAYARRGLCTEGLAQEDEHQAVQQTTSGGPQAGLRTETTSYDVREFGTKKGLRNLPYLLRCMNNCNQRLLRWEDSIDQTTVSSRYLEKLGQPTVRENGQRVPGLNIHHPRLYRVLAAVLQFAHLITGFRNRELREYLQRRFGLSPDEYTAAQLRYDLLKLRAKGWIRKLEGKALYVLTPKGMAQATTLAKLNECLNGTLGHPPSAIPKVSSPQTEVQKGYRKVRQQLQKLLQVWGIAT